MTATPIPTHLICTVFQYIFPPSLPLPPHLLSRSLIERHHYLGISPSDVASYLLWSSSHTAQVTEALEEPCPETLIEHDVRYSAPDRETLLAHVRPHSLSPLQIVFAWDVGAAGWKYHDARMLPFPEGSQRALGDVLNHITKDAAISEAPRTNSSETSRDDDNYWAMYDSTSSPTTPVSATDAAEDEKTEAAYWASYNTIQGSGDSAIPSPAQPKTHLPSCKGEDDLRRSDILIDPLITRLHLRLNEHDGLLHPLQCSTYVDYKDGPQQPDYHRLKHAESESTNIEGQEACDGGSSEADEGVKDAIRGIYRMWKCRAASADMESFLDVVRSALET